MVWTWISHVLRAFQAAISGLVWALRTQRNLKIHLLATCLALSLGWLHPLENWEWCVLALAIGLVWAAELLNTAVETVCDRITREPDEMIRRAKDVSAAAVVAASIAALAIGILIFT
ncbi:diacylglycerol kinase (ATP) [Prosthecobacter debontii]|uniref:Diacylglycerol kinase (ATP) n=1 Tax=Prosthecobacter debontii TaxID=48467 RepID=A0A1T4XKP1_9BACT|nr:diacylglycerol kinase family protein [Prosthecobacter debontii]SKA90110.1 diacylglycerol kinase (ATP) [Prosthecobacter debontii]